MHGQDEVCVKKSLLAWKEEYIVRKDIRALEFLVYVCGSELSCASIFCLVFVFDSLSSERGVS